MGKRHLARLAVIDTAAAQIPADRRADDYGTGEVPLRPPAHVRQLVANLHHGWPDVVKELDLDHRL